MESKDTYIAMEKQNKTKQNLIIWQNMTEISYFASNSRNKSNYEVEIYMMQHMIFLCVFWIAIAWEIFTFDPFIYVSGDSKMHVGSGL